MDGILPGTAIEVGELHEDQAKVFLSHVFSGGGIAMSQLCTMTGLEPYLIQNWVKRGFVQKPSKKTYNVSQFCRIVIINMLRGTMSLDEIVGLMSYINGALDDSSDDRIPDEELYNLFINVICRIGDRVGGEGIERACADVAVPETDPATDRAIREVLRVMVYAYYSAELKRQAQVFLRALD